ncbi:hypothetical protein QUF63_00355 [Anaerolineales bacterium HSG25]|nr:hypothetical protein [Anaerolineales bacterium HSG25]
MKETTAFVVCINNSNYEVSLERLKIYQIIPDVRAEKYQQIRVVDESGEDYLYPASYFARVELPKIVHEAVFVTA